MPTAMKAKKRTTPIINITNARFSCPGLGTEMPRNDMYIQKRLRRGSFSGDGSGEIRLGKPIWQL